MQEWTDKEIILGLGWLVVWVFLGFFSLYSHNLLLQYIYLIFALGNFASHLYLACTRCAYFGKRCYILGGRLAPSFFKQRAESPLDPDDAISSTMWFILGIFPVPFLLYYQDWILLLLYSALTYGWFYYRKAMFCTKCGNGWCPTKPRI